MCQPPSVLSYLIGTVYLSPVGAGSDHRPLQIPTRWNLKPLTAGASDSHISLLVVRHEMPPFGHAA